MIQDLIADLQKILAGFLTQIIAGVAVLVIITLSAYIWHGIYKERKINGHTKENVSTGRLFWNYFAEGLAFILRSAPKIIVTGLVFFAVFQVGNKLYSVNRYFENEKRIKELKAVIKNMERQQNLGKIQVLSRTEESVTYKVTVYTGYKEEAVTEEITLPGREFYFDCIVINFDYSQISSGTADNIAYPYRFWSERLPPEKAHYLTATFTDSTEQVPIPYLLKEDVYGIEPGTYLSRIKELFSIINDEKQSRQFGIRSTNGAVIHITPKDDETYTIKVENTGGLSLHKEEAW
ncbi:MAG: hypothetical protein K6G00_09215 [Treponema sp.]|nr:hypothetical protein [Treponema sp.]